MEEFPSNSNMRRPSDNSTPDAKKVEKVVTGQVVRRKKTAGRRFSEAFINGDAKTAADTVLWEVVIPKLKDLVWTAISEGSEGLIYGQVRGGPRGSSGREIRVEGPGYRYDKVSAPPSRRDPRQSLSRKARSNHNFDEIVIETRVEAEETLSRLYDLLERYEEVSVADLYDMLDLKPEPTDNKWGWTQLRTASVVRARGGGFILELPRPEPLD